ncbi:MAG: CHRD domain-containing protein [Armatimonadota bacterium]
MRRLLIVVVVLALLVSAIAVMAAPKPQSIFRAQLSGDAVVPPAETNSHGVALFKLSGDGELMYFKLIVANIEDVVAAHIHLGAPGVNGPVQVGLYTGGLIEGRFQGTLAEGSFPVSEELLEAIRAGETYVQVHTVAYPGGHIRGQIR